MVERLLQQKALADEVMAAAWGRAEPFAAALRDALTAGLNCRQNKPAELIAKYIDARLRAGGAKGLSDAELEAALDAALVLFRAIQVLGLVVGVRAAAAGATGSTLSHGAGHYA